MSQSNQKVPCCVITDFREHVGEGRGQEGGLDDYGECRHSWGGLRELALQQVQSWAFPTCTHTHMHTCVHTHMQTYTWTHAITLIVRIQSREPPPRPYSHSVLTFPKPLALTLHEASVSCKTRDGKKTWLTDSPYSRWFWLHDIFNEVLD